MINTKITINGVEYTDIRDMGFIKSISDNNASSSFTATVDSPYGRHKTDFQIGNEVKIYVDRNNIPAGSNIFTGVLERIGFTGEETEQKIVLEGRDYSIRLQDNTVQPVVFTNQEVGSIVKTIIAANVQDITVNNVGSNTGVTLARIAFNQISVFDAIDELAQLAGYQFYVDTTKDLHFSPENTSDTNINFFSGNIISMDFDRTRERMANKFYIYGDRQDITAPRETFTVASQGSVFTLKYQPHDTSVSTTKTAGSLLKGGIFNMVQSQSQSGIDYLVSFYDNKIILVSGAALGYNNIPADGGSVVVDYTRSLPIVKYGEDAASITAFGPKTEITNDKTIKDPNTATKLLQQKLSDTDPFSMITLQVQGLYDITPGQTANVILPDFNINSTYPLIQARYNFNAYTILKENVMELRFDKKIPDLTDELTLMKRRLDLIESQDRQVSDLITRLQTSTGSMLVVGSRWYISSRWNGSEFRVWPSDNTPPLGSNFTPRLGLLNSGAGLGVGSMSYLASGIFGTPYQIVRSGGHNY